MACSHLTLDFTQFLWASLFIKIPFYCTVLVGGQNSSGLARHAFARLGRRVGLFTAFPYGNFDIVWDHSRTFLSYIPPHTRRVLCSAWYLC